jgi:hypothetical protein
MTDRELFELDSDSLGAYLVACARTAYNVGKAIEYE